MNHKNNVVKKLNIAGAQVDIIIVNQTKIISTAIKDHWPVLVVLFIVTIIIPLIMLMII